MIEQLGHYRILEKLGEGGMGEVYRARDTRLGRTVAIKVLPAAVAGDEERRARFLREARAAAALSHPSIAALYEIGEDQGHLFLVFEFVPGDTLRTVIGGRPMHPHRAIQLAAQIADALADAHAAGIVHRDIKPDNVIVTPKGHAKVLDFGLATWTAGGIAREQAAQAETQTRSDGRGELRAELRTTLSTSLGSALGTVAYMSPEQSLGEPVDERTDIFSLGVVLYEMLTGGLPFRGQTATALALQIVQAPAPRPSASNGDVPKAVDPVVTKALAKRPDDRFESAALMAAALRAIDAALDAHLESAERASAAAVARGPGPSGISARPLLVGALLVIAAAAGWYERSALERLFRGAVSSPPEPVIAVVPLELADGDASRTYFADGLTEDLITRIGQTPGVKVLGRSATRSYRGRTPRDLARELGAGVVLTGTVRPAGDLVKVSLELVNAADGTALWTNQYTREVKDIFAVQALVAADVAGALRLKLQPTAAGARTASRLVDQRAYDLYLRGRQAAAVRDVAGARRLFEQAIQLDDGLPEAHAGLAEALRLEGAFRGAADDPERFARLKRAADRAYELDPDLPQANLAVGLAAERLADSLASFKKAIISDPTYSEGFHQIGDQIQDFDPIRSIAFYRRALALDPRMDVNRADIVNSLAALGKFDEAQRELAAAAPGATWTPPLHLALALERRQYDAALAVLQDRRLIDEMPIFGLSLVNALKMAGRDDEALREATALVKRGSNQCEAKASLAGLRQERGQAALARQLVAPALEQASAPDASPSAVRCGALSAAAIGDAASAASLLKRIASEERMLRDWALEITGTTGSKMLRRAMFPWTHVYDAPPVVDARAALDRAYAREREQIAAILGDVTP